jgi:hypothetical protein
MPRMAEHVQVGTSNTSLERQSSAFGDVLHVWSGQSTLHREVSSQVWLCQAGLHMKGMCLSNHRRPALERVLYRRMLCSLSPDPGRSCRSPWGPRTGSHTATSLGCRRIVSSPDSAATDARPFHRNRDTWGALASWFITTTAREGLSSTRAYPVDALHSTVIG